MKLSEAIRKGFVGVKPIDGHLMTKDNCSACALGAALIALGLRYSDITREEQSSFSGATYIREDDGYDRLAAQWPWLEKRTSPNDHILYPSRTLGSHRIMEAIYFTFDDLVMAGKVSNDQFYEWVEKLEAKYGS